MLPPGNLVYVVCFNSRSPKSSLAPSVHAWHHRSGTTGPSRFLTPILTLHLDERGFRKFLRYIENNPVLAGLVRRAWEWKWPSAAAHCLGESQGGRLCLAVWENVFERPKTVAQEWAGYLVGLEIERRLNAARLRTYNRPADCWAADDGERVGSAGD